MNRYAEPRKKIGTCLSFGGGVQSTVIALMVANGELPMIDFAVFADTKWEPQEVYDNLQWTIDTINKSKNPFPFHVIDNGRSLREDVKNCVNFQGVEFISIPLFTDFGPYKRHCTSRYKIYPITSKLKEIYNPRKGKDYVEQWIGFSLDEIQRVKASRILWIDNQWPLIDKHFTRKDCHDWFHEKYPNRKLAKSSCIGCPYHSHAKWSQIKERYPNEFQEIIEMEKDLQHTAKRKGLNKPFFSSHAIPIELAVKIYQEDEDFQDVCNEANCFT